ncbi:MAG: hypothetical protein J3R72DRAFT_511922 [Linnemannia gamsii]|nr:MAG: hypothetical protein J3R72DRAFT_511922 [Linnemannia gamsii]
MLRRSTRHQSQQLTSRPSTVNNSVSDDSGDDGQANESDQNSSDQNSSDKSNSDKSRGSYQSNSSQEQSDEQSDNDNPDTYRSYLLAPESYTIQLHLRSGEPYTRCRSITNLPDPRPFLHTIDDSYGMLHEIVRARTQKNPDYLWQEDSGIYLQPSHNAPQKNFKEIDDSNYEVLLEDAWRMEGRRLGELSSIIIHVYVYLQPTPKPGRVRVNTTAKSLPKNGLQRATKSRTVRALGRIRQEERAGRLRTVGHFTSAHLVRHMARRPETLEDDHPVEIPDTNIFRQTNHLDRELDDLRARRAQEQDFAEKEFAQIRIRISGQVVILEVERRSLREAIGIPDIDLNGMENFRGDDEDDGSLSGSDMVDADHIDLE